MRNLLIVIAILGIVIATGEALRQQGEPSLGVKNRWTKRPLKSPRIVGGEVAPEAFAPWQVSIQNRYGNHFCSGSIIGDEHILTAASCVAGLQPKEVYIVTSTNDWMGPAWLYKVTDIKIHCNFDRPLYANDIALLKLASMIAYDEKTQNITLAGSDDFAEGGQLTMTGWGSWELGSDFPNELKKLDVNVVSHEECQASLGHYGDDVDIGHLCVLSKVGGGACHGDGGNPLVNSRGELVGVGNWGVPCGRGFPDMFANIRFYYEWIKTSIQGCPT